MITISEDGCGELIVIILPAKQPLLWYGADYDTGIPIPNITAIFPG